MGIRTNTNIRIKRHQIVGSVPPITSIEAASDSSNQIEHLMKKISRHGTYPKEHWSGNYAIDVKKFNFIVDKLINNNPEVVFQGQNNDTAPGAIFKNLESPVFSVGGKKYTIFITFQTSPRTGEIHYREISLLDFDEKMPNDPRPARIITLTSNNTYKRLDFVQFEDSSRDLWWQMKQAWGFFNTHRGNVKFPPVDENFEQESADSVS